MERPTLKPFFSREEALVKSYYPAVNLLEKIEDFNDVVFDPTGSTFAVVSENKSIYLFDTFKCTLIRPEIKNYKYRMSRVLFDPVKSRLFVNSFNDKDHKARLLDIESNSFELYFNGPTAQITSMCCTSKMLITSSEDCSVRLHDTTNASIIGSTTFKQPCDIALHPNGNCLAVSNSSIIQLFDIRAFDKGSVCSINISSPCHVKPAFGPIGTSLLVTGQKYAKLLSLNDLSVHHNYEKDNITFTEGAAFTPDEKFVAMGTTDKNVLITETAIGGKAHERAVLGSPFDVERIAFSTKFANFVTVGSGAQFWSIDATTLASFGY